jgi:hypothetical protein
MQCLQQTTRSSWLRERDQRHCALQTLCLPPEKTVEWQSSRLDNHVKANSGALNLQQQHYACAAQQQQQFENNCGGRMLRRRDSPPN